jgi:hypothetical protein
MPPEPEKVKVEPVAFMPPFEVILAEPENLRFEFFVIRPLFELRLPPDIFRTTLFRLVALDNVKDVAALIVVLLMVLDLKVKPAVIFIVPPVMVQSVQMLPVFTVSVTPGEIFMMQLLQL